MKVRVRVKLAKPHPSNSMAFSTFVATNEWREVDVDPKHLDGKGAKHWLLVEKVSSPKVEAPEPIKKKVSKKKD